MSYEIDNQPKPFASRILRYEDPPDGSTFRRNHTEFGGKLYDEERRFISLIGSVTAEEMIRRWNNHESLLEACKAFVAAIAEYVSTYPPGVPKELVDDPLGDAYRLALAAIEKASKP